MPLYLVLLFLLGGTAMAGETPDQAGTNAPAVTPKSAPQSPPPKEMPVEVMARVGSYEITVQEFMQFLARNPSRVEEATTDSGKANLLRGAIEAQLLRLAMKDEGLITENPTPPETKKALAALEDKYFPLPPPVDDETSRQYYLNHLQAFSIPASVRLSQIQFRVPQSATEEQKAAARTRAEDALRRIEAGESFEAVASDVSDNTITKAKKGDVGFVWRNDLPWLVNALQGVKVGTHTGILPSPVGYDILLLTDEREAVVSPYEDVKDDVVQQIRKSAQQQVRAEYVKSLAQKYKVEIVLDELKGEFANGIFP